MSGVLITHAYNAKARDLEGYKNILKIMFKK
jgi:hypothetical protein